MERRGNTQDVPQLYCWEHKPYQGFAHRVLCRKDTAPPERPA